MQAIKGGPGRGRYLVSGGDSGTLIDFIDHAGDDPTFSLLDTIGPQDKPHTAVFEMPHDTAAALARRFQTEGTLKIEPDSPLSMFSSWQH